MLGITYNNVIRCDRIKQLKSHSLLLFMGKKNLRKQLVSITITNNNRNGIARTIQWRQYDYIEKPIINK